MPLDDVLPLSAYRTLHARNLLIFNASIGQSAVHEFLTFGLRVSFLL